MKHYVVIPAHNEEEHLKEVLEAIDKQSLRPDVVMVVNDNSTDRTGLLLDRYQRQYSWCRYISTESTAVHLPGSKVINAFNAGLEQLDSDFDFITKLDADVILPKNYFERIIEAFQNNADLGITGGYIYEKNQDGEWELHHPMAEDHVRGAIKSYRGSCFRAIGGLKNDIGWDTVDELLARYNGFQIQPVKELEVKHLRPLGAKYSKKARRLQGRAMYIMRYGFIITLIASLKMAWKLRNPMAFIHNIQGFLHALNKKAPFLVNKEEGKFIRALRWDGIRKKLF